MNHIIDKISVWHLKRAYIKIKSEIIGDKGRLDRLNRAMDILCKDNEYSIEVIRMEKNNQLFKVTSPNGTYEVSMRECNCPDGAKLCKHRLALRLLKDAFIIKNKENKE